MGTAEDYDEVLKGKYPARAHAKKVADWMVAKGGDKTGTIYLEAQKAKLLEACPFHGKSAPSSTGLTNLRTMIARRLFDSDGSSSI
jgi:hypothetical protein